MVVVCVVIAAGEVGKVEQGSGDRFDLNLDGGTFRLYLCLLAFLFCSSSENKSIMAGRSVQGGCAGLGVWGILFLGLGFGGWGFGFFRGASCGVGCCRV